MVRTGSGKGASARRFVAASTAAIAALTATGTSGETERARAAPLATAGARVAVHLHAAILPENARLAAWAIAAPAKVMDSMPPARFASRSPPGLHQAGVSPKFAGPEQTTRANPAVAIDALGTARPLALPASRLVAVEIATPFVAITNASHEKQQDLVEGAANAALASARAPASAAYVAQVSDSERAAYIAQVETTDAVQRMAVRSGDDVLGAVEFHVSGGVISVHVGQVLDLFEGRMDSARFAALRSSPAASEYVSLDLLHGAGVPLQYNAAYDELTLATVRG